MRSDLMLVKLDLATAVDRARLGRIRGPRAMRHFVHWNWFWLDRALSDAAISVFLLRTGPRNGIIDCLALGPHERVDLDPASRSWTMGELFHLVIDARYTGRGYGRAATEAAIVELGARAVHVEVGEQRADHAALRRAMPVGLAPSKAPPSLAVPFFDRNTQPQLDQMQHVRVADSTSHALHELAMTAGYDGRSCGAS
jgi:hypothetical protein